MIRTIDLFVMLRKRIPQRLLMASLLLTYAILLCIFSYATIKNENERMNTAGEDSYFVKTKNQIALTVDNPKIIINTNRWDMIYEQAWNGLFCGGKLFVVALELTILWLNHVSPYYTAIFVMSNLLIVAHDLSLTFTFFGSKAVIMLLVHVGSIIVYFVFVALPAPTEKEKKTAENDHPPNDREIKQAHKHHRQ